MKYEILVEGGFTGFSKKYEGEIGLGNEDFMALFKAMNESSPQNVNLCDGLIYRVTLFDNEKSIEARFDEKNLPHSIRQMLIG